MIKEIKWSIDPSHSEITFKVKHLMISNIKSAFKKFDASIYTTGRDFFTSEIDLWIDAASLTTGDEKRDEHLKGPDFFDVENYKQITFTASGIAKADEHHNHELWGDLTIKGISKRIKLNAMLGGTMKDPAGNEKAGFTVTGKINRKDWGLNWNYGLESGGVILSEEVIIECDIQLLKVNQEDLMMQLETSKNKKEFSLRFWAV